MINKIQPFDTLNEQQEAAATFKGKHLLVLAGAGTGKTRTIVARAKYLLESGVSPKRILILSFTRKSAMEIVWRVSHELREQGAENLSGQTFHSWCMGLMKRFPQFFPYAKYTVIDEDDKTSCFKLLCGKKWNLKNAQGVRINPKLIISIYSYAVNTRCSLSNSIRKILYSNNPEEDVEFVRKEISPIIKNYLEYKNKHKYLDFDDILLSVSETLTKNPNIRKVIAKLYDHILIDEMQDTNPLQYELLQSFYEDCAIFCVGDDAQSIYGFRGADFKSKYLCLFLYSK